MFLCRMNLVFLQGWTRDNCFGLNKMLENKKIIKFLLCIEISYSMINGMYDCIRLSNAESENEYSVGSHR